MENIGEEEKYTLVLNMNEDMKNIMLKEKNNNEILANEENVLFISDSDNKRKLGQKEIELIVSISRKHSKNGILIVDITNEIKEILKLAEQGGNLENLSYKKKLEWMIRQAITKALVEKGKENN